MRRWVNSLTKEELTEFGIRELILEWGQWDLNPRPPAPQASTSS
jgi:hypothetical protein